MKAEVTICDNCKTQKKQANKWWTACVDVRDGKPHGVSVLQYDSKLPAPTTAFVWFDLCGSRCVSEWISKTIL